MATDVQDVLGSSVKRVEDPRFITGKGRYLDDIKLTGMVHMAILRSPYAHANIRSIDASQAIAVDYEPLPAVVDAEKATQPGAPQLHDNAPNNVVFDWTVGDKAGTEKALAEAEVVVRQRLVNHRLIPNPME